MLKTYERTSTTAPITFSFTSGNFLPKVKPAGQDPEVPMSYILPSYISSYSKIRVETEGGRSIWKPVQHYVRYTNPPALNPPGTIPWYTGTSDGAWKWIGGPISPLIYTTTTGSSSFPFAFGSWGVHTDGLPALTQVEDGQGNFVPLPSGIDVLIERSLAAMLPGIKSELSLINSVIELKDFASLPQTLRRVRNAVDGLPTLVARAKRKLYGRWLKTRLSFNTPDLTLRELTRSSADGYLQTQFNLLPLLSDITGIYTALSRTERRINDLIVRQGKRRVKHFTLLVPLSTVLYPPTLTSKQGVALSTGQFSGQWTVQPVPPYTSQPLKAPFHAVKFERRTDALQATFHAEVEYNYHFTQFQVEHARLLATLDALGVNLNPAIIWNAIPWSFVVDWVLGVGQYLSKGTVLNMAPVTNISRFLWSWKVERRVSTNISSWGALNSFPTFYADLPDLYESVYRREVGIPYGSSILSSGLSAKELSLGVALAITRRRRSNTRTK